MFQPYTAVFNDPYGNKNTAGYPSYDGARVFYDWPGYNNGYANLNTVHAFVYCRFTGSSTEHLKFKNSLENGDAVNGLSYSLGTSPIPIPTETPTPTPSPTPTPTPPPNPQAYIDYILTGEGVAPDDLNGDGKIDVAELITLLKK